MLPQQLKSRRQTLQARVDVGRFHDTALPPVASWRDGATYLGPCVASLRDALERVPKKGELLTTSAVLSNSSQSECTLHVESGWRVGAAVTFVWRPEAPGRADLRVLVYSRAQRWLTWGSLALGIAIGVVAARLALPGTWDPKGRLLGGLLAGAFIGVALIVIVDRTHLGRDTEASADVARRLARAVEKWLDRNEARAEVNPS